MKKILKISPRNDQNLLLWTRRRWYKKCFRLKTRARPTERIYDSGERFFALRRSIFAKKNFFFFFSVLNYFFIPPQSFSRKLAWLKTWRQVFFFFFPGRCAQKCFRENYHEGKRDMACFLRRWLLRLMIFSSVPFFFFSLFRSFYKTQINLKSVS